MTADSNSIVTETMPAPEQSGPTYGNLWLVCSNHSMSWWLNPAFPGNDQTIGEALAHFTGNHNNGIPCLGEVRTANPSVEGS